MMRPKPWLEKHPQTLTLIGCLTVQTTFFFPGKFQTNPLTEFKRMVVSTEKIICSQLVALWSWAHFNRFFRWPSVSTGFHKGWLYILLLLRSSVVVLFSRWSWLLSYLFDSWCLGLWRMFVVRRAKKFDCCTWSIRPIWNAQIFWLLPSFQPIFYCRHTTVNCFCHSRMTKLWTQRMMRQENNFIPLVYW